MFLLFKLIQKLSCFTIQSGEHTKLVSILNELAHLLLIHVEDLEISQGFFVHKASLNWTVSGLIQNTEVSEVLHRCNGKVDRPLSYHVLILLLLERSY